MTINDNPNVRYSGKKVSPPNNYYAYFYFAGGDPNERGICVLFHASYFIGEYHCGAGLLLSISTANRYPAVQRIALIEENVYHAIACTESFDIIKQILKKDFQKNDGPIICLPEMQKEHNILYKVIEPFVSSGS